MAEIELVEAQGTKYSLSAFDQLESVLGVLATEKHAKHELLFLYELANGDWDKPLPYGYTIQTGVHFGASLCMLGMANEVTTYGIDPYRAQSSGDGWTYDHDKSYVGVRNTIWKLGLEHRVCLCIFDSVSFCMQLPKEFPVRLAFIDSNHTADHVRNEIAGIAPLIVSGGWMVFHDVYHIKLPEYSKEIEQWIDKSSDRYDKWLRLRKYPEAEHELSHIPMSIVACRKK